MFLKTLHNNKTKLSPSRQLPAATKSLCPLCRVVVNAELYEEEGGVMMNKSCDRHGNFTELISSNAELFLKICRSHYERPEKIDNSQSTGAAECPKACGLCRQHISRPAMVNIDLTNRCNMNCPVCFANSNATGKVCELTLEQVKKILDDTVNMRPRGPACLQFVGGEPTIHSEFIECVRQAKMRGLSHVQVATNGLKFAQSLEFCQAAGDAGLDQIYLQFDGLSDEVYNKIRGRALVQAKQKAIDNIRKANMRVVLVPTIAKGINDDQVGSIARYAVDNVDVISAVSWQPVAVTGRIDESQRLSMRYTLADLARDLEQQCGFPVMQRDWYPFSIVTPFLRLMRAIRGKPQISVSCHPHCGAATYMVIDRQTKKITPLPAFIDVEPAMADLDKMAARIEKFPWLKGITVASAMKTMKKYFNQENAPQDWGFDRFLEFIQSFVDFEQQHTDKAAYHEYLKKQRFNTLLFASMHFQDVYNYEIERSKHCIILYAAPNGRFYPFCTWNSGPSHRYSIEEQFAKPLEKASNIRNIDTAKTIGLSYRGGNKNQQHAARSDRR